MKAKWKNRILPRGVFVDTRGYVVVRKFHAGKRLPKKSFGKATAESVDAAIRWMNRRHEELRVGDVSVESQKSIRWPFPYALKRFVEISPKWRYYQTQLNSFFGAYYFDDLWFKEVEKYRPFRKSQIARGSKSGRKVKDSSINKELACLSAMYYTFRKLKQLRKIPNVRLPDENPCIGVEKVDEAHLRRKRIITPDEFQIIMSEASARMRRRILAALNTGLRQKDVFALSKGFMDPYQKQLEGLAHKVGSAYKTAANSVMEELYATADGDRVVDDVNHDREFNRLREVCVMKHKMPDFIFKDFRRTGGMAIWEETKDILLCMAFFNHKKVTTTQRYLGISNQDLALAGQITARRFNFQTVPQTVPQAINNNSKNKTKDIDSKQIRAVSSVG